MELDAPFVASPAYGGPKTLGVTLVFLKGSGALVSAAGVGGVLQFGDFVETIHGMAVVGGGVEELKTHLAAVEADTVKVTIARRTVCVHQAEEAVVDLCLDLC